MAQERDLVLSPESHTPSRLSLGRFLWLNLREGIIGPENASRLLCVLPEQGHDDELEQAKQKLREPDLKTRRYGREIIACALRKTDDFDSDETVLMRYPSAHSGWERFSVIDRSEDKVRFEDGLMTVWLPPYYPALLTETDFRFLEHSQSGTGHISPARFVIRLSDFDPRMAAFPDAAAKAARHFGAARF